MFEPEKIYFTLLVSPGAARSAKVGSLISEHWNDRFLVFSCSRVTSFGWISPTWKNGIPIGVFTSAADARKLANELGLTAVFFGYDRDGDEMRRVDYIRRVLSYYAGISNGKEQLSREEPELYEFLDRYPHYWKLFDAVPEERSPQENGR